MIVEKYRFNVQQGEAVKAAKNGTSKPKLEIHRCLKFKTADEGSRSAVDEVDKQYGKRFAVENDTGVRQTVFIAKSSDIPSNETWGSENDEMA